MLEVAAAVDAPQVAVERVLVERLAHRRVHARDDHPGVHPRGALDADLVDLSAARRILRFALRLPRGVLLGRNGVRGELVGHLARRGFADRHGLGQVVEVGRREVAEFREDEDVLGLQRRERRAHVLLGEDVDHLPDDADDRGDLFARHERRAEIHRDHHIGAHLARDVDRRLSTRPPST